MDGSVELQFNERELLDEAKKRFEECETAHAENRDRYVEGIKFVNGEQWDEKVKRARRNRPCLTMNRTSQHVHQVVNDFRQNKPQVKVHPTSNGDIKVAEIYDGLIRNIQHVSNADEAYETACWTSVAGNQGYVRILTDYCDDTAFEQDIVIKKVGNPMSIWFDPHAKEMDGSDARYVFVEDRIPRDEFEREYGKEKTSSWSLGTDKRGWYDDKSVRVVEYFRVITKRKLIYMMPDGSVTEQPKGPHVTSREADVREVQWFKVGGDSVLDSRKWPSKWIPVVRVIGDEIDIEGKPVWKGLTHNAMDPARTYNYFASTIVEQVTMQPKAPFIGAKGQFEGQEGKWSSANVENHAYLEYTPVDINGTIMPPPQRQSPPTVPTGAFQVMQQAAEDLQWITGQHAASFGARSNEASGRAILARQQEGDTATYHYLDNMARCIRHVGRVIVDMIPRIYDTPRILRILGEDGTSKQVQMNPEQPEPVMEDVTGEQSYNLKAGRYDVAITVGPSYTTRRMEAVDAMTQLLQANPALFPQIGDIYLRNQDWPGAQAMAERLAKMVPPELKAGEGEGKEGRIEVMMAQAQQAIQEREAALMQAQQMIEAANAQIAQLQQEADKATVELQKAQIDAQAKVQAEQVKAEAEVAVAQLTANRDAVQETMPKNSGEMAEIKAMLLALAASKGVEMPEAEEPEEEQGPSEEEILAQGLAEMGARIAEGMQQQAQAVAMLAQTMSAPKRIVRDETGRPVGVVQE